MRTLRIPVAAHGTVEITVTEQGQGHPVLVLHGGGGPQTGGPTTHPTPPEMPPPRAENAASGRLEEDPLAAAKQDPEE